MKKFFNLLIMTIALAIIAYLLYPLIPKDENGEILVRKILEACEKMK